MNTYNVETNVAKIEVIVAVGIEIMGGALVFKNQKGGGGEAVSYCFNKGEWKRVWLVE